jgi:hypothetical protein
MALVLADRVQETTATTGTGSITLSGAVSGYQSFAVVGNGNTCYYTIVNNSAWEVGIGTYSTTGPTLARTTVLSNSSGNTSPITLSGASSVFLTYPAEKSINYDADGVATIGSTLGYSDSGIIASFASTVAGYNQVVLQNKSTATNASANLNISNDASTSTTGFAELGINSSTFSNGAGAFNIPGAAYLASASTDLSIGTYGAYNIHFATNSSTTDSMTIFNSGGISLGGYADPGIGNISANKFVPGYSATASAGGTTVLTAASNYYQRLTGTSAQTFQLPDATTLVTGTTFIFDNDSTGTLTIKDGASTTIDSIPATGIDYIYLINNGTVAGTWIAYSFNPSNYDFTSTSANFGGATISNAVWNGTAIAGGYGGTGLTSFVAANNALYSTGSTTLTAGTLPVAAGGTGITSLTANYIPVGNGTSGFTSSSSLQFASGVLVVGGSSVLGGATNPITAFTGNTNNYIQTYVYNQSTGTSASSDFVAYTDNSTDAHGWADMGFTSSTYADPVYTVTGPNEAYVLGSALNSTYTGNLVYATDSTGSANAHQWYVGGFTQAKSAWKMQLTSTGLSVAGNAVLGSGSANNTTVSGAATGLATTIASTGSDTNISQVVQSKGTGAINLAAGSKGVNISNGGTVTAITRTNGGTGYTVAPTVVISAPTTAGGVQATATCTVTGGVVDSTFTITNAGSGYVEQPTITFTPVSGGSGATAYATVGSIPTVKTVGSAISFATPAGEQVRITDTASASLYVQLTGGASGVTRPGVGANGTGASGFNIYNFGGQPIYFATNGAGNGVQAVVAHTASAVNYVQVTGAATTVAPVISAQGSDTNIGLDITSKGTSSVRFKTSGGTLQFLVTNTGSAVNYLQATGGIATAAPVLSSQGTDTNIDLTLTPKGTGNVVASSGAFSGSGSLLTSLNASNLSSGTVGTARLASGTASSSTYLRGDQTWATISAGAPGGSTTQIQYNSAGSFAGSANLTFDGTNLTCGGTVTANSDETLKTNWRDFSDDFIEQLAKVKHGTYDRLDIDLVQDGVSAQSLQRLMPNSVLKGENGTLSVAYGNAALVAAIKLADRVVELEARLAALEK